MTKSGLYDIRGRDWQTHASLCGITRWTECTAKMVRDQPTLSPRVSIGIALGAFYTTVFTAARVLGSAELRTFS